MSANLLDLLRLLRSRASVNTHRWGGGFAREPQPAAGPAPGRPGRWAGGASRRHPAPWKGEAAGRASFNVGASGPGLAQAAAAVPCRCPAFVPLSRFAALL